MHEKCLKGCGGHCELGSLGWERDFVFIVASFIMSKGKVFNLEHALITKEMAGVCISTGFCCLDACIYQNSSNDARKVCTFDYT